MLLKLTWLFLLMMFFQLPYYKPEAGPLYGLAKVWPFLLVPLVIYGSLALRLPDRALYLAFTVYALAITPFLSMIHLPNNFVDATASAAKAWPVTFYFSAAAALVLLRPSEGFLARAIIGLGVATFALMLFLWIVVPVAWYQPGVFGANIFSWDSGRGEYIRMPLAMGEVAVFWMAERFARERRIWQAALLAGALASMLIIYKARLPTGVTAMLVMLIIFVRLPLNLRWALGALAAVPLGLAAMLYGVEVPGLIAATFDESLFIRLRSSVTAWDWIWSAPSRLIFGGGSISTFSAFTMGDYFNAPDFWLTDIGWLGILLEYGIVGTGLIIVFFGRALFAAYRTQGDDPFRHALTVYIVFEILCSGVYSLMYAPGPVVTIAAISWWLVLRDGQGLPREQPGLVLEAPASRQMVTAPPAWAIGQISHGPR